MYNASQNLYVEIRNFDSFENLNVTFHQCNKGKLLLTYHNSTSLQAKDFLIF